VIIRDRGLGNLGIWGLGNELMKLDNKSWNQREREWWSEFGSKNTNCKP